MFTKSPPVDFAAIGLIKDQPAHSLAPGAWTESLNVRAKDGSVQGVYAFKDSMLLHGASGTCSISAHNNDQNACEAAGTCSISAHDNNQSACEAAITAGSGTCYITAHNNNQIACDDAGAVWTPTTWTAATWTEGDHGLNPGILNGDIVAITQFTPAGSDFLIIAYIVAKGNDQDCSVVTFNTHTLEYADISNTATESDLGFKYNESYPPQIFMFNGMLIVNPANDAPPQFKSEPEAQLGSLQLLPNWSEDSTGSALVCRTLRPFNNRLIAMNVLEEHGEGADIERPINIIWSSVVTAPRFLDSVAWAASSTNTAGDAFMTQTPGKILDGMQLGPYFIAYKDDAVIQVRETGDIFVLSFETIFEDDGIFSPGCVAATGNNQHIVWGNYGVYIHDGQTQKQDIAKGIVQEYLFDNVESEHRDRSFVFKQTRDNEVWFCYSELSNTGKGTNKALVFDYISQVWHKRTVPQLLSLTETELDGEIKIYGASPGDTNIQILSTSAYVAGGFFEQEKNHLGTTAFKQLTSYEPNAEAKVLLAVAGTVNIGETAEYANQEFNPSSQHKLDKRVSGRYMNVKATMANDPSNVGFGINPKLTTISFSLKGTARR